VWQENVLTVRGEILHEKVDSDTYDTRGALKTVRGLRTHSFRWGIVGRADVVEFRKSNDASAVAEVIPVEFKSGQPKDDISDKVRRGLRGRAPCGRVDCSAKLVPIVLRTYRDGGIPPSAVKRFCICHHWKEIAWARGLRRFPSIRVKGYLQLGLSSDEGNL
jgi:hypothetical protein